MNDDVVLFDGPAACHGIWGLVNTGRLTITTDQLRWERGGGVWRVMPGTKSVTLRPEDVATFELHPSAWGDEVRVHAKDGDTYAFATGTRAYLWLTETFALLPLAAVLRSGNWSPRLLAALTEWTALTRQS